MPNFFPFGMPYWQSQYYKNYYNAKKIKEDENFDENSNEELDKNSTTRSNSSSTNNSRNYDKQPYINILGIDLFSDDILILCILFFLYTEGIKDEMLFICLILLLLT